MVVCLRLRWVPKSLQVSREIFKACHDDGVMRQSWGLHRGAALPTAAVRRAEIVGSDPSPVQGAMIRDGAATGLPAMAAYPCWGPL